MSNLYIGIDPGASGGIASYDGKELYSIKCPSGGKAMAHSVRTVVKTGSGQSHIDETDRFQVQKMVPRGGLELPTHGFSGTKPLGTFS